MSKEISFEITSHGPGLNLPVADINSLFIETCIKLSKKTQLFSKSKEYIDGLFNFSPYTQPILSVISTIKSENDSENDVKETKRIFGVKKILSHMNNFGLGLQEKDHKELYDRLNKTLLKVVLYLWYEIDSNYKIISKNSFKHLPFPKRYFAQTSQRKEMLNFLHALDTDTEKKKSSKSLLIRLFIEFEVCLPILSKLIKYRCGKLFIYKTASIMDVMLYTYLMCILYPQFDDNIIKNMFKNHTEVLTYINDITKLIYPMYVPSIISLRLGNKKIEVQMLEEIEEDESKIKKETKVIIGIGITSLVLFYIANKHMDILPPSVSIFNFFKKKIFSRNSNSTLKDHNSNDTNKFEVIEE